MTTFDNPENLSKVTELLTIANEYTGGYLGSIILMMLGFGTFLLTSQFSTRESLLASSFVMLTFALFLKFFFGLIGDVWVYGTLIVFIGALAFAFATKDNPGAWLKTKK